MQFRSLLLLLNATLAMALIGTDVNGITSLAGDLTSRIGEITSAAGELGAHYTSALSDIRTGLENLQTYSGYSSLTSAFATVVTAGPSAVSIFVGNLPSEYDSSARSSIASVLVSAANRITTEATVELSPSSTSPSSTATSTTTSTTGAAGSNKVVGIWIVAAVGLIAVIVGL